MRLLQRVVGRYRGNAEPLLLERRIELVALGLCLLLLVQLAWWGLGSLLGSGIESLQPATDSLSVVKLAQTPAITAQDSRELQSRPLFWASRRPFEPVDVKVVVEQIDEAPGKIEGLILTGLVFDGEVGAAICDFKGRQMRLSVGDKIAGWTLESVSHNQAVFVAGAKRDIRRLKFSAVPSAASESPGGGARTGSVPRADDGKSERTFGLGG